MFKAATFAIFAFALSAFPAAAQQVQFKFELKDGLTYTEHQHTVRNATVEGTNQTQTRESDITTQYTVKKVAGGYDIVARTLKASMKRDGKSALDPVTNALSSVEATMRVSDKGEFVELKDADKLLAQIMQSIPEQARPALQNILTVDALVARTAGEWNARVPRFMGMNGEIGDAWTSEDAAPLLTGGQATFYTVSALDSFTSCGKSKSQCVRVTVDYNTDPKQLSESFGEGVGNLLKQVGAKDVGLSDVKIVGKGEFVVDPATSMLHSEKMERTMEMIVTVQQKPMRTHVVETRSSEFSYN